MGMSAFYSTQSRAPLEENLRVLRKAIDYKWCECHNPDEQSASSLDLLLRVPKLH